jgi:hypothetical protein
MICRRNAAHSQPRALEGEISKAAATTVRGSLFCDTEVLDTLSSKQVYRETSWSCGLVANSPRRVDKYTG